MGVYGEIKRNSQALKAEQVQLSAGDDGVINIIYDVAEAPNIEEEVALADTRGLYGQQNSTEQKFAHQQNAFGSVETAVTKLLTGAVANWTLDLPTLLASRRADTIYAVLLEVLLQERTTTTIKGRAWWY